MTRETLNPRKLLNQVHRGESVLGGCKREWQLIARSELQVVTLACIAGVVGELRFGAGSSNPG